jgi:hypothetical protein
MKYTNERDSLTGFLRDLDVRLARQERHTHRAAPAPTNGDGGGSGGGLSPEEITDLVAAMFAEGTGIDIAYNDALDTITITNTGTSLPAGGTVRQVLSKNSSTAGDASWRDPTSLVVKATAPTAADYGTTSIPANAVWVVRP